MKSCRFPLTRHSDGNTFLNLYPNGRVVTLNNTLDDGSGDITASGWIEAGNGGAVIFGGTSAVNGSGSGGASFSGRPRIGDWGQWLTIGEPNGTNNGTIIQIDGSSQHIGFGTSSGITNSPSIKSRINISSGGRFEGQTSNYAYLANGQYNSTVNGGGNRTFGNFTTGATGSVHVTGFFTASGNSAGTWYIWLSLIHI